jgi:hypothetical protein
MDVTTQAASGVNILFAWGPMGVCLVYFMVKDWVRGKKTDDINEKCVEAISDSTSAIESMTNAALLCNRNGSTK